MFHALADPVLSVRSTSGTILTTILSRNMKRFPDVIPKLIQLLETSQENAISGTIDALLKICEDSASQLSSEFPEVVAAAIPKLIQYFKHPNAKIRSTAVSCLNEFVPVGADPLLANMDPYVTGLYQLTGDTDEDVRRAVCQAFVFILESRPECLMSELHNVIEFMLYCTQSDEESVAIEACEFWLTFGEHEELQESLIPYLSKIVPVLLKGMIYNDEDIVLLGGDDEDASVPDNEQDIKPRHYKAKTQDFGVSPANTLPKNSDLSDFEDDEDFDDDDEFDSEWNLRKCSASAIDMFATLYGTDLLGILLPLLKERLFSSEWEVRESAILAIGAIAEGCIEGMIPHLSVLVPLLVQNMVDSKGLVRSISCWTVGRYTSWICSPPHGTDINQHHQTYLHPVTQNVSLVS